MKHQEQSIKYIKKKYIKKNLVKLPVQYDTMRAMLVQ